MMQGGSISFEAAHQNMWQKQHFSTKLKYCIVIEMLK